MKSAGLTIRRARSEDRDMVWPLARDFATSFRPDLRAFHHSFDELVGADGTLLLVAQTEQTEIIGYLLARHPGTFLANGPVAWAEEVMVDGRFRRQGVGRALMEEAERWSRAVPASYVALASRRPDDFYAALGYEPSATFYRKSLV